MLPTAKLNLDGYPSPRRESSPLNKSVSFSQQVKVREFPAGQNGRGSPLRNVKGEREDLPVRRLSYKEFYPNNSTH